MLQITIPAAIYEEFDEERNEFIYTIVAKEQTLQLEHSLVSLSKWESKWRKPFLTKQEKTDEEILDYIKYMTITQNVKPELYERLTEENFKQINKYIDSPMTATTFSKDDSKGRNREIITAELIYYWMIALNIPFECQKWHLNRLLTLIRVCNIKNAPPKKMSKRATASKYAQLNAARRQQLNSRG
jgi:macrodomain Ter protein organizer (MatP/YcbG family)